MKKLERAQRNCHQVLKQVSQVSGLCASHNRNQDELSDETNELEHCLAQSSVADHELLDAIVHDSEYEQVFDQCQKIQKTARQTLQAAKKMIAASSQPINLSAITQTHL